MEGTLANVLVVDDTPEVCTMLERLLTSKGHAPVTATSGTAALQLLEKQRFDVAVVDHSMPPPDGLEVLQKIRDRQPACARILMSGMLGVPVLLDAVNRGEISRVLAKPFKNPEFLALLDEAIAVHKRFEDMLQVNSKQADEATNQTFSECLEGPYLQLAAQPIMRANPKGVFAYELLLRSTHPILKGPMPILEAAERTNRVADLADVVARLTTGWLDRVPKDVLLFVNLHPRELENSAALKRRLDRWLGQESRVVIEITERSAVMDMKEWEQSVGLLSNRGFSIAVDDVGSGYNSLSVLAELTPRFIKVDMSIVRNIHQSQHKRRLVELLCRFADATQTQLIAEGIENDDEERAIRECGAHLLQGYHFGKPSLQLP